MIFNRLALICIPALLVVSAKLNAQDDIYPYCNSTVQLLDQNGDTLDSGSFLLTEFIQDDQLDTVTIRYASDIDVYNIQGNLNTVVRKMDVFFPDTSLKVVHNGEPISKTPVIFLLHARNGDKNTIADKAQKYCRQGYICVTMTYRNDYGLNKYCFSQKDRLYKAAQDVRASMRMFTMITEDFRTLSNWQLSQKYPQHLWQRGRLIASLPTDLNYYFIGGFSFGSTVAVTMAFQNEQEDFESFLYDGQGYTVDGEYGPVTYGNAGLLDDVGIDILEDYPFPLEKIKGVIARTGLTDNLAVVDFSDKPAEIPLAFFHGTCDEHVPYDSLEYTAGATTCDPVVDHVTAGFQSNTFTNYGTWAISEVMRDSGYYNEMHVFCGGGHNTNVCVTDLIFDSSYAFINKIVCGLLNPDAEPEIEAWRLHPNNYSDQCCADSADLLNHPSCNCGTDEPIELPLVMTNGCYREDCDDMEFCPDNSAGNLFDGTYHGIFGLNTYRISQNSVRFEFRVSEPINTFITLFDIQGRMLHQEAVRLPVGQSEIELTIPSSEKQILLFRAGPVSGKIAPL